MKKKALALVLVLCIVLSMLPMTAFAAQSQPAVKTAPVELDKLAGSLPGVSAQASYAVSLTGGSHGETELLVSSPAPAGSEVYFLANPDDGYPAEVYVSGIDPSEVFYVGFDVWGFYMPGNKVTINVKYVAATGSSHNLKLHSGEGGQAVLTRTSAKVDESVYLAVLPDNQKLFNPEQHVFATSGSLYYLYMDEETGAHYYELFMPDEDVNVFVEYCKSGPFRVSAFPTAGEQSCTVKIEPQSAYFLDTVTVTIIPAPGYALSRVQAVSWAGDLVSGLTPIGSNRYTFTMHPGDVDLYIDMERTGPIYNPVTVTVETGLGGSAAANVTEAKAGDTVTLTCSPDEGYRVAQITGVDNLIDNGDNTYTFTMPDEPVDLKVLFLRHENPFLDVNETHYFYKPVLWAKETGVTAGIDATHFGSDQACTRAQVVTFLWSVAGKPDIAGTNPFTDVPAGSWYEKPILWAVKNGITAGTSATTFSPDQVCTRAQVVTFMWGAAGKPAATGANPFTDVPAQSWYTAPILWALENGITSGTSATTFGPGDQCLRAQVVTFLYKAAALLAP